MLLTETDGALQEPLGKVEEDRKKKSWPNNCKKTECRMVLRKRESSRHELQIGNVAIKKLDQLIPMLFSISRQQSVRINHRCVLEI